MTSYLLIVKSSKLQHELYWHGSSIHIYDVTAIVLGM